MKFAKKILCVLWAFALPLAAVGCSANQTEKPSGTASKGATNATDADKKINNPSGTGRPFLPS